MVVSNVELETYMTDKVREDYLRRGLEDTFQDIVTACNTILDLEYKQGYSFERLNGARAVLGLNLRWYKTLALKLELEKTRKDT